MAAETVSLLTGSSQLIWIVHPLPRRQHLLLKHPPCRNHLKLPLRHNTAALWIHQHQSALLALADVCTGRLDSLITFPNWSLGGELCGVHSSFDRIHPLPVYVT